MGPLNSVIPQYSHYPIIPNQYPSCQYKHHILLLRSVQHIDLDPMNIHKKHIINIPFFDPQLSKFPEYCCSGSKTRKDLDLQTVGKNWLVKNKSNRNWVLLFLVNTEN